MDTIFHGWPSKIPAIPAVVDDVVLSHTIGANEFLCEAIIERDEELIVLDRPRRQFVSSRSLKFAPT
jgi:hypothetical protein